MSEFGFYRKKQLRLVCGLSMTQIDRLEKAGAFPKRCLLSGAHKNSAVGWLKEEIHWWCLERITNREAALRKE